MDDILTVQEEFETPAGALWYKIGEDRWVVSTWTRKIQENVKEINIRFNVKVTIEVES